MPEANITYHAWRKSTRSGANGGNCVEVGFSPDAAMTGIRDTKDRAYGTLEITRGTWASFLDRIKAGELNRS